jgi:hypothetical protein
MPFAIGGSAISTFSGSVWVTNGPVRYNSAPGSVTDFATADGGGNVTSSDSYLRVGYSGLLNTNGFLYFVGDSSVSYVSGVQTLGTPPTTTYTYQNADPEVGSLWPQTIGEWGNQLIFANSWGVHVCYGSRATKISDDLDGVYPAPPGGTATLGSFIPSAAKAIVFDRKIWCLLIPIIDPVLGTQQTKLLMWDGKEWWAGLQDLNLTYIQTQEINSILTAWGTDGTHLYPLFQTASTGFSKTLQTKLWADPGGLMELKATGRFWGLFNYKTVNSQNITLSIDNEAGQNAAPATIAGPGTTGLFVTPPYPVAQQGVLTGMTLTTSCDDVEFEILMIQPEIAGART